MPARAKLTGKSPASTPNMPTTTSHTDVPSLLKASAPAGIRITKDAQADLRNASLSWAGMCMKQLWELDDDEVDDSADAWQDDIPGALEHLTATAAFNSGKLAEKRPWSLRRSIGRYARPTRATAMIEAAGHTPRNSLPPVKVFVCALMHDSDSADFEYGILCIKRGFQPESTMIVLDLLEEKGGYATVKQEMHVIQADVEAKDVTTGPIMAMIEIGKKRDLSSGGTRGRVESKTSPASATRTSREVKSVGSRRASASVSPVQTKLAGTYGAGVSKSKRTTRGSSLKHITFVGSSLD